LLSQQNELHAAIAADMDIFDYIPFPNLEQIKHSKFLVLDANPPVATLLKAAKLASSKGVCIILEPTSVPKVEEVAKHIEFLKHVSYATPNIDELQVMASVLETKVDKNLCNLTNRPWGGGGSRILGIRPSHMFNCASSYECEVSAIRSPLNSYTWQAWCITCLHQGRYFGRIHFSFHVTSI
jgi:hypothetical protein